MLDMDDEIGCVQLHQYDLDAVLAVTDASGVCQLSVSQDMLQWQSLSQLSDCMSVTPWFVYAQYPSKIAAGRALFLVGDQTDDLADDKVAAPCGPSGQVNCTWGTDWHEAALWETRSVALHVPAGAEVEDVTIAAHVGDSACTFVMDVCEADGHASRPWFVQPSDVAVADEVPGPLPFDAPSTPRRLRIVNRARNFWLVTYLRMQETEQRLFWGVIDWAEPDPCLRELSRPDAFTRARSTVGFD